MPRLTCLVTLSLALRQFYILGISCLFVVVCLVLFYIYLFHLFIFEGGVFFNIGTNHLFVINVSLLFLSCRRVCSLQRWCHLLGKG